MWENMSYGFDNKLILRFYNKNLFYKLKIISNSKIINIKLVNIKFILNDM